MSNLLVYPVDAVAIALLAGIVVILILGRATLRARTETACLTVAGEAHVTFFKHADTLLASEETPQVVQDVLLRLMEAMVDESAGRKAFEEMVRALDKGVVPSSPPPELLAFRDSSPELYEELSDALRGAMTGLLMAYGPYHERVQLEYRATTEQSVTYALAKSIGDLLSSISIVSDRRPGNAQHV